MQTPEDHDAAVKARWDALCECPDAEIEGQLAQLSDDAQNGDVPAIEVLLSLVTDE
jgi:hypothetical protein